MVGRFQRSKFQPDECYLYYFDAWRRNVNIISYWTDRSVFLIGITYLHSTSWACEHEKIIAFITRQCSSKSRYFYQYGQGRPCNRLYSLSSSCHIHRRTNEGFRRSSQKQSKGLAKPYLHLIKHHAIQKQIHLCKHIMCPKFKQE